MKVFMKAIAAIMLTVTAMVAGCTKPDNPPSGGGTGHNNYNYVDLCLPSGTLWATCNVGAATPEEYGYCFAWGETSTKTTYKWSTYIYCKGDINKLTKYCSNTDYGHNGFTDTLTSLLPENDAATINWGSAWTTPTADQWRELKDYTTNTWTTQNGVKGRLFTASNGNSIFLPAAGNWGVGDEFVNAGSYGFYWSSSLITDLPYYAWYFYFDSDSYYVFNYIRCGGLSVRPVLSVL